MATIAPGRAAGTGTQRRSGGTAVAGRRRALAVLLGPFFALFALFFVVPIGYAIYESLFRVVSTGLLGLGGQRTVFAGLSNYQRAFADSGFAGSLLRILLFAVVEVPVMISLAVVLALLLDSASARWPALFRSAFFAPYGVPGVIASLLWGFLYIPRLSPIVSVLGHLGWQPNFLGSGLTLWSIANIVTWSFAGYNVLVVTAQIKAIPLDLYEAAGMDGAGQFRIAWSIKLPLARPAIILATVFTIIGSIQLFAEPLVLQQIDNNISPSYTPNLAAYNNAFQFNNYNLAAAESVIVAILAIALSFTFLKVTQRREGQK